MKRSFHISGLTYYDLEGPIGQVISTLQKFQNRHPNAALRLYAEDDGYGSPYVELSVAEEREETDEERIKREQDEAARAAVAERRQRLEYEALKAKFGDS